MKKIIRDLSVLTKTKNIYFLLFVFLFSFCTNESDSKEEVKIVGWGDSMMYGWGGDFSILQVISKELDSIPYKNFGVGGLKSNSIAALQGGNPLMGTLTNDTLFFNEENEFKNLRIKPYNNQTKQIRHGTINGINGTIRRDYFIEEPVKEKYFTFKRLDSGAPIVTKNPVFFSFNNAVNHTNDITIIWSGRNDNKNDENIYNTRNNILAMVSHLNENSNKKYLILSVCNGISDNEGRGSLAHTNILNLNTLLKYTFKDHFVDVRHYLVNNAIYDMGIIPSELDIEDVKKDCIPRSLLKDHVHLNTCGYESVGLYLASIIKEKGWLN